MIINGVTAYCGNCPQNVDSILKLSKVIGYAYCPRCGRGSISIGKDDPRYKEIKNET